MSYSSFSSGYGQNQGIMGKLGSGLAGAESGASGMMSKFRNNKMVSGGTDFLYSNSLVAKVCFLVLSKVAAAQAFIFYYLIKVIIG